MCDENNENIEKAFRTPTGIRIDAGANSRVALLTVLITGVIKNQIIMLYYYIGFLIGSFCYSFFNGLLPWIQFWR